MIVSRERFLVDLRDSTGFQSEGRPDTILLTSLKNDCGDGVHRREWNIRVSGQRHILDSYRLGMLSALAD
jgi:hypothetical protein